MNETTEFESTEEARIPSIVVLISGNGTNLQAVIDGVNNEEIQGKVTAVLSNKPDAPGLALAEQAGIETHVVDHKKFEQRELFDAAMIRIIDKYEPDLVVLAGFMRILTDDFVRRYQGKMLNIHPSLLPKYPGVNTYQRAIEAGEKEHGTTVHFVTPELDSGPNIIQAKVPVLSQDTPETLAKRVKEQEHIIYPIAVKWFVEGRLSMVEGKALLDHESIPESGLMLDSPHTLH